MSKFYAVRVGRQPGIYPTWADCEDQIKKFPGAKYKKFSTESEAQAFVEADGGLSGGPERSRAPSTPTRTGNAGVSSRDRSRSPLSRDHHNGSTTTGFRNITSFNPREAACAIPSGTCRPSPAPGGPSPASSQHATSARLSQPQWYYAVHKGRTPGIYLSWPDCESQVNSFFGARYRKFPTLTEAEAFVRTGSLGADSSTGTTPSKAATRRGVQETSSVSRTSTYTASTNPGATVSKAATRRAVKETSSMTRASRSTAATGAGGGGLVVYTDGCCHNNGRKGGKAGIGVYWGERDTRNLSEPLSGRPTNNRAEIYAAKRACDQAKLYGIPHLSIHTDSMFMIDCMTKWIKNWKRNGWKLSNGKDVINKDDLLDLEQAMTGVKVDWVHVRGHRGIHGNEMADRLANDGARKN